MLKQPIQLKLNISEDDPSVAYLYLYADQREMTSGVVKKQVRLLEIIDDYKGPDIYLDFDKNGVLIGIEIT